jgi:hypothetical protein
MSTTTLNCTEVQQLQHQKEMALGALRAAETTYMTKNEACVNLMKQLFPLELQEMYAKCFPLELQEEIAFRARRKAKAAYLTAKTALLEYNWRKTDGAKMRRKAFVDFSRVVQELKTNFELSPTRSRVPFKAYYQA